MAPARRSAPGRQQQGEGDETQREEVSQGRGGAETGRWEPEEKTARRRISHSKALSCRSVVPGESPVGSEDVSSASVLDASTEWPPCSARTKPLLSRVLIRNAPQVPRSGVQQSPAGLPSCLQEKSLHTFFLHVPRTHTPASAHNIGGPSLLVLSVLSTTALMKPSAPALCPGALPLPRSSREAPPGEAPLPRRRLTGRGRCSDTRVLPLGG